MRAMKDSGIKWIGEIPEEWEVCRLKDVGNVYGGLTGKSGDDFKVDEGDNFAYFIQFTNIFNNTIIDIENLAKVKINDGETQNKVSEGDILVLMSSEDTDGIGKTALLNSNKIQPLYLNSFCKGFHTNKNKIVPLYLNYYLMSDAGHIHSQLHSNGFIRINLRQDKLLCCPILMPTYSEQQRIATYLDTKCGEIDELIGIQEKFIEELKAYKQSVITEAVTKGLNPNATLKDSGVEWIGEIPEDWKVVRLKFLCKNEKYAIKTGPFGSQLKGDDLKEYGDTCVYTQRNVIDNDFSTKYSYVNSDKAAQLSSFLTKKNDLLLTSRGTIGRCAILSEHEEMGILHPCLIAIRLDEDKCLNQWLQIYFNHTSCFRTDIQKKSNGTTIEVVYTENLKNTFIPICSIDEQKIIIDKITATSSQIDSLITLKQSKIEELKSFKKSLIYEYVTGKKTVPENV